MLRRYSKARSVAGGSTNGDVSNNSQSPSPEVYEKRIKDLTKAVEESQKNADRVSSNNQYEINNGILVNICKILVI